MIKLKIQANKLCFVHLWKARRVKQNYQIKVHILKITVQHDLQSTRAVCLESKHPALRDALRTALQNRCFEKMQRSSLSTAKQNRRWPVKSQSSCLAYIKMFLHKAFRRSIRRHPFPFILGALPQGSMKAGLNTFLSGFEGRHFGQDSLQRTNPTSAILRWMAYWRWTTAFQQLLWVGDRQDQSTRQREAWYPAWNSPGKRTPAEEKESDEWHDQSNSLVKLLKLNYVAEVRMTKCFKNW